MDKFLYFFEHMPPYQKTGAIVISLAFCWFLEYYVPMRKYEYSKFQHGRINLYFLVCISVINVLFGLLLVHVVGYLIQAKIGLFYSVEIPKIVELLLSVIALDLISQYAVHVCLHKIPWMWKFHIVHHSDQFMDATSGTRHHPIDYFLREVFSMITIVLLGIPVSCYFFYRFCSIFFTYVNHSNIVLPERLNKWLSLVFVTPNMHKFHHHYQLPWTDKNYGNIFSFWDRLFGTYVKEDPRKVKFGIDKLGDKPNDNFLFLLTIPWKIKK